MVYNNRVTTYPSDITGIVNASSGRVRKVITIVKCITLILEFNCGYQHQQKGSKNRGICQGTPAAYPPVTGQGCLNECGSAKAG
jgi:hypothetical protein